MSVRKNESKFQNTARKKDTFKLGCYLMILQQGGFLHSFLHIDN